jgi:hypothetical protein
MPARAENTRKTVTESFLFWCGVALLLVSLGFVILPTLNLGFVADDFFLLVPDQKYPLAQSPDELHRPLRNVILRLMARAIGIQNVLPYRLLVAGSLVLALILLFQFTRRLGTNRLGALAALFALAFFPRNYAVLNWFSAWQDIAAAVAVLCACVFFLDFRASNRGHSLILSVVSYLIALGFKETTAVIPILLVAIDFYRERSMRLFSSPQFWKAYIPFGCALLVYAVYFFSQSGFASLTGKRSGGYYGFHGFAEVLAGLIRAIINIALPYSTPLGFKDVRLLHAAVLLFGSAIMLVLVWRLRLWAALMLTASWVICAALPTAAFASYFNADRYLFVPTVGVAVFFGLSVHALVVLPKTENLSIVFCAGMALYTWVGVSVLAIKREQYREEGKEVAMVIRETMRTCSMLPARSEVAIINLTHSFSTGLLEALYANGLSRSARVWRNFSAPDLEQQAVVGKMLRCVAARSGRARDYAILVESDGKMLKLDTECASSLVDQDRAQRPGAWALLSPGK